MKNENLEQTKEELKPLLLGILFLFICNSIGYIITNEQNSELIEEIKELNIKIDSLNNIINLKQPPFQKENIKKLPNKFREL